MTSWSARLRPPASDAPAWNALFAPKGTPKATLGELGYALSKPRDDAGVGKRCPISAATFQDRRGAEALSALVKSEADKRQGDQGGGRR